MTPRRGAGPDALTFTERARRQQLIDATIDLISTRGYPATSLSAIAERAGLSKAAVLYLGRRPGPLLAHECDGDRRGRDGPTDRSVI